MSIYAILASKPHNTHYVNRYVRFIERCQKANEGFEGYTEKHHVCPKSLFPEYKSFAKCPWNKAVLTARQHFVAHWILWKAYPEDKAMLFAFWNFRYTRGAKPDSRTYVKLREEVAKSSKEIQNTKIKNGTHHLLGGEIQRRTNRKKVKDGTHHFLGGEIQRRRVKDGTHNLLGPEHNTNRVKNGTHPFLGGEIQRKKVKDGTHHLLGTVSCYDKQGNCVRIPKELYYNQSGPVEDREYVNISTKEGKRRKLLSGK